jgi:hypothetical protein
VFCLKRDLRDARHALSFVNNLNKGVDMQLQLIAATAFCLLISTLVVARDGMEGQRCIWRCLADSSGPSDPAYDACVEAQCGNETAPSHEAAAPAQRWRAEEEPDFTDYPTAFVQGEPGGRIGMLGLFCVGNDAFVYVADIPGEVRLPMPARIEIDNQTFSIW